MNRTLNIPSRDIVEGFDDAVELHSISLLRELVDIVGREEAGGRENRLPWFGWWVIRHICIWGLSHR